ncbi:hypothetical protein OTK49_03160 [Vibrio coralliirubri]|uniref:hypothetical protein n=1 Tax=Vibrio coralliirubri TaxID=1516159 RepID=UPI002283D688|nr:hypothetical protein [Vibrio coralliirubri]MCY9861515.1 hypothetical protein [Vibrio coralliirubri]
MKNSIKIGLVSILVISGGFVPVGDYMVSKFSDPEPELYYQGVAYKQSYQTSPENLDLASPAIVNDFTAGDFNEICQNGYQVAAKASKKIIRGIKEGYRDVDFSLYCWNNGEPLPTLYQSTILIPNSENALPLPFMFGNIKPSKATKQLVASKVNMKTPIKVESGTLLVHSLKVEPRNTTLNLMRGKYSLFEDISYEEFSSEINKVSLLLIDSYKIKTRVFAERAENRASWGL